MKKLLIVAALVAGAPMLAGCAGGAAAGVVLKAVGEAAVSQAAEALAPEIARALAPEIREVARVLQGSGAIVVERRFERKFAGAEASIDRGEIGTVEAARKALAEADGRKKVLDGLRIGNDYTQKANALSLADRQRLLEARFTTDEAYGRLAERLQAIIEPAP